MDKNVLKKSLLARGCFSPLTRFLRTIKSYISRQFSGKRFVISFLTRFKDDFIYDDEELYRSVRSNLHSNTQDEEYVYDDENRLRFRINAFRDRKKEPSIDRAKLRNFNPSSARLSPTDGIVSLIAKDVRSIGDIVTRTDPEDIVHAVDIIYDPRYEPPKNLAHSRIIVKPEFFGSSSKQKKSFKLLQIALARLATKNGWTLPPASNTSSQ